MKNLAGVAECDSQIVKELTAARIWPVEVVPTNTEVPYSFIGHLGAIEFTRSWTYWVAKGPVPIDIAQRLYKLDTKRVVRCDGYAGGAEPTENRVKWMLPSGREVMSQDDMDKVRAVFVSENAFQEYARKFVISDDPLLIGARRFVTTYHIDTQEGLELFALASSAAA